MIDWTTIIVAVVGFFSGGGIMFFFTFRENKLKARGEAERSLIDNYEIYIERMEKERAMQDERFDRMNEFHTQRYDDLDRKQSENSKKISDLEHQLFQNKKFICYNLSCEIRQSKPIVK